MECIRVKHEFALLATALTLGVFAFLPAPREAHAQDNHTLVVRVVRENGAATLTVNSEKFFIKGAGGDGSKTLLKELGGNSFRTWGVDDSTGKLLDEAQRLGLKVTLGIWLGHKEHGFDYSNADQVAEQIEAVRNAVQKYRNHPALLMWALGNEMEGDGNSAAIWSRGVG